MKNFLSIVLMVIAVNLFYAQTASTAGPGGSSFEVDVHDAARTRQKTRPP